jgi:hypothetical protein
LEGEKPRRRWFEKSGVGREDEWLNQPGQSPNPASPDHIKKLRPPRRRRN